MNHISTHIRDKQSGFTLIEVLVTVILISIVIAATSAGFNQAFSRSQERDVNQLVSWLQASADIAVLQSSVLGVTAQEGQISLLAFYQDDWYRFNNQEIFVPSGEIGVFWSEELVRAQEEGLVDSDDLFPYLVIMPTGQILPEGKILITDKIDSDDIDVNDINNHVIAELQWNQDANFQLEWVRER